MMTWYLIIFVFMVLMGAFALAYQIFRLTELDAKCRGLKHPKWWGLFSLSGNNPRSQIYRKYRCILHMC